jgi:hypothetical protein
LRQQARPWHEALVVEAAVAVAVLTPQVAQLTSRVAALTLQVAVLISAVEAFAAVGTAAVATDPELLLA